jgi:hypothetical protein
MTAVAATRLRAIGALCRQHGVRFAFLVPPSRTYGDEVLLRAASLTGVTVIRPIQDGTLPLSFYEDGFHLNGSGAERFTDAAAEEIRKDECSASASGGH